MPKQPPLDRLHQHTQAKRTTKRTTGQSPTLSEPADGKTMDRAVDYPKGHFGPKHGLTPAQAWTAQQLLNHANRHRPLRGPDAQARFALRMAGILSAVKGGRVGNSAFGRSLHGHRGGQVMARWGVRHLREIAPPGSQAAAAKRQEKKALQDAEEHRPGTGGHDRQEAPLPYPRPGRPACIGLRSGQSGRSKPLGSVAVQCLTPCTSACGPLFARGAGARPNVFPEGNRVIQYTFLHFCRHLSTPLWWPQSAPMS